MKILGLIFLLLSLNSCQKEETVTIGHQLTPNPWKYLIASGKLENLAGKKVIFKKFNSGAKVINAMASGNIDIAVAGSTPIAAGISQGLPIKLVSLMHVIGDSEAFVVRNSINSLEDLKGKKIGVPFGSTTHFHLMVALNNAGISTKELSILNLTPPSIVASWKNNEIDAAFVWAPALEEIKKSGKVLLSSKDLATQGNPTFDGIIARDAFIKENKPFLKSFIQEINSIHTNYNQGNWNTSSEEVKSISNFVGSSPEDVISALSGNTFPTVINFSSLSDTLKKTADFLKSQGKIETVLEDYSTKIVQGL